MRIKSSAYAAFSHFLVSLAVLCAVAWGVFGVWYPHPFNSMMGVGGIFLLLAVVDVVCGPLLTFVVFDVRKKALELTLDLGLIVLVQFAALVYGLHSLMEARPVWLAFEGDRYRIVSPVDFAAESLKEAPPPMQQLSLTGPRFLGVTLTRPGDKDFLLSIQRSLEGEHPAFRPERWVPYEQQLDAVRQSLQPVALLIARYPEAQSLIQPFSAGLEAGVEGLGFLPVAAKGRQDWIALVNRQTGFPVGYLPLNGWGD